MAKFKGAVLNCTVCGNEFKVPACRAATAKACSHACAVQVRAKSVERKVDIACKECGKVFQVPQCHMERHSFCSLICREANADTKERKTNLRGIANPSWKGGRTKQSDGYIYIREYGHPFAGNGYVLEHRMVMERHLLQNDPSSKFLVYVNGRLVLSPDYEVHHGDEDRKNNMIENLECLTPAEHRARHAEIRRAGAAKPSKGELKCR